MMSARVRELRRESLLTAAPTPAREPSWGWLAGALAWLYPAGARP
ncbi:MAG TPA: hypothetical protein PLL19_13450 [Thiobacillaceae bacterium]|nr:hypothetical protein [Thiobacillaceae bacterium]HNF90334.1 hypothetical protein [Thiobacillaceae bacterium]HNH90578.1 hypothetical protein [Thiobacillaceae bacterium]HNI08129.1 hypothetical protein [Thiobacillaceae bacterium]